MSLAKRLGMKTEKERQQAREKNAAKIKRKIRASNQTIMVLNRRVKCIDASAGKGYRWTGSGLMLYAGKIIERIDWPK